MKTPLELAKQLRHGYRLENIFFTKTLRVDKGQFLCAEYVEYGDEFASVASVQRGKRV